MKEDGVLFSFPAAQILLSQCCKLTACLSQILTPFQFSCFLLMNPSAWNPYSQQKIGNSVLPILDPHKNVLFFQLFNKDYLNLLLALYFFVLGVLALTHLLKLVYPKKLFEIFVNTSSRQFPYCKMNFILLGFF